MRQKQSLFEKLLLPHLDGAYNLARWIVKRDQDAQAVVQEAYIQALKEFVKFRGAGVRSWLLTIVRNTAYTWIQKRGNNLSMIPFEEAIHVASSDKPLPEPSPEERQRHLYEALSKLPFEFREVLVLREIEGWSYEQLASALNVTKWSGLVRNAAWNGRHILPCSKSESSLSISGHRVGRPIGYGT